MPQLDGINLVSTEQMKLTFIFLLGLSLQSAAGAASFDCNKAATQVEKMICADAEVSRIDETMHAVYRSALQDKKGLQDAPTRCSANEMALAVQSLTPDELASDILFVSSRQISTAC